ncbi:hypothetical protein GCM10011504_35770 [Siccirubricoccus deserti]|uniref:Uncharacterized protein n=1 Tax=Siccirubricoccus deserti TaxID=2013562 RepID=A0A9X0R1S9_9PROT|nr:hypothetical protein [Siccirubricoccus deserti]MBC4017243.1 hypothetical protein [Siccirubricoccus deserti]GGC54237.1 hypothetical protein GCM10011504_35770 [Siccirubricoccus deserti]
MAQPEESAEPQQLRLDAVQCPHCDQVTMPNLLADRSAVCSCPAERALPLDLLRGTPWDGMPTTAPAPVDDGSFIPGALPETRKPTGEERHRPATGREAAPPQLPEDHGQFGRDVATEAFAPLASPPGRKD